MLGANIGVKTGTTAIPDTFLSPDKWARGNIAAPSIRPIDSMSIPSEKGRLRIRNSGIIIVSSFLPGPKAIKSETPRFIRGVNLKSQID